MTWGLIHLLSVVAAIVAAIFAAGFFSGYWIRRKGWL